MAAARVLSDVLARLDGLDGPGAPVAAALARDVRQALGAPAGGTMRAWMQAAHGSTVHTVQVDGGTGRPWVPLSRTVDASRGSYVTFNGSRRDYAGMRVAHSTPRVLIVQDEWHTIAYVLAAA